MTLHPKIKTTASLANEAFSDLKKLQDQEDKLIKTGRPFIDNHLGGLLPSSVILLGAASGIGKTYEAQRIMKGIFSKDINAQADEYVSLEYMLEMKFLDLILRDANSMLNKKKSDILTKPFTEEEKAIMREYYSTLQDGRRFIVDESVTSEEYFEITRDFCRQNQDKKGIVVLIDHLLLILESSRGEDPLKKISEYTNILRKEFKNVYFLFLSQLNRSSYADIKEKSNAMVPNVTHIYGSSHFEFLSSYAIIMFNPFKLGVEEYMKVNRDRYPDLEDFLTVEDSKGRSSFNTLGNMFYHMVKIRESDDMYNNLYIEKMNISEDQIKKMSMDAQAKDSNDVKLVAQKGKPVFETPPVIDFTSLNKFAGKEPF
jgi:archaellum biogenesis ATPase FlaH